MNGIDYSAWRPPSPQWLLQNGFGFVVRYLKVLPNSYAITAAEYRALLAAGVAVVLNWEQNEYDWQTNGISYAQQAKAQAQALGAWPCPIYFSIDTGSPSMAQVDNYFAGVSSVIGPQYTGIYGGYDVVTEVDKRYVSWFWQTYAWSNGRWADVHIRQVPGGTNNYDLNQAMAVNFGQVGAARPDPPAPAPPEVLQPMNPVTATRPDGNEDYYVLVPDGSGTYALVHTVKVPNTDTVTGCDYPGGKWLGALACGWKDGMAYFQGIGSDQHVYEAYWNSSTPTTQWQIAKVF